MRGINVPGIFTPGIVDGYITESRWIKGTYIVVNTVEEANQIPLTVRVNGTPVYVVETRTEYRWINGDWEVKPQPLQDAPADGKLYARLNGAWAEVTIDTSNLQQQIDDLYSKLDEKASLSYVQQLVEDIDSKLLNYASKEEIAEFSTLRVGELPDVGSEKDIYIKELDGNYQLYIYKQGTGFVKVGDSAIDLSNYYTKAEINSKLELKADKSEIPDVSGFITKDVDNLTNYTTTTQLSTELSNKQDKLQSGVNVKTINGQDIVGAGDIEVTAEIREATTTDIGGFTATDLGMIDGTNAFVGMQSGKAFVKIPKITETASQSEVVEVLNDGESIILNGN